MSTQILNIDAVIRRPVERRVVNIFFANRNRETFAETLQFVVAKFLLLMRDVPAFTAFTETIALDGAGQNDSGLTVRLNGLVKCCIHFFRIMATETELAQVFI